VITRRAVAFVVDALLLALIPTTTALVVGRAAVRRGDCPAVLPAGRNCIGFKNEVMLIDKSAFFVFVGVLALLYLGVFVTVQAVTGASPGKALLGLRVVRADGTTPGWRRSLVRLVAWLVDGLALLVPVALWSAWLTPGHRRVGDWVAGTYVVRSRRRPPTAGSLTAPAAGDPTERGYNATNGGWGRARRQRGDHRECADDEHDGAARRAGLEVAALDALAARSRHRGPRRGHRGLRHHHRVA
jgi:uncharacterized RDD family membrane protein YckC